MVDKLSDAHDDLRFRWIQYGDCLRILAKNIHRCLLDLDIFGNFNIVINNETFYIKFELREGHMRRITY